MAHKPKPQRGTSTCRRCGEKGHNTKTCDKYAGKVFGSWTVLRGALGSNTRSHVLAECVCGVEKVVAMQHLKSGKSTSCGCSRSGLATTGSDILMPEVVTVYGAPMTLGERQRPQCRQPR
jgi:hypothetical protein